MLVCPLLREREEGGWFTGSCAVLLQFGKDVFPVGVFPQSGDVWTYFVHQDLPLCGLGHVNHLLNDVVCILVLHHCVQCTEGGREGREVTGVMRENGER